MTAPKGAFPVPTHQGGGTGTAAETQRIERGSTLFCDIAALLDGGLPDPPQPTFLTRDDGHAILYAGQVNSLFGEAESGKTFILLAGIAEASKASSRCAFIDIDHNGVDSTVVRLLALGVSVDYLSDPERFRYWAPESADELMSLVAFLRTWHPAIVGVDSVGELLPLLGLNSNSPDDFTAAHASALKPLATAGAAVVIIDHLAKNTDSKAAGPTGTAAKRRAVGGVSIRVTIKDQFTPGNGGSAWLTVNKDRHGGLRQHCPRGDREPSAGLFILEERDDRLVWNLRAPSDVDAVQIIGAAPADLDLLGQLDPTPESVRDVKERMGWGTNRASKTLDAWRSRNVPEEHGTGPGRSVPRSHTPMSGNGEHPHEPLPDEHAVVPPTPEPSQVAQLGAVPSSGDVAQLDIQCPSCHRSAGMALVPTAAGLACRRCAPGIRAGTRWHRLRPSTRCHQGRPLRSVQRPSDQGRCGMSWPVPIRPAALPAWHVLVDALSRTQAGAIPCNGRMEWSSDDQDDRTEAAERCAGCPATVACSNYATAAREKFGVWGGVDRTPSSQRAKPIITNDTRKEIITS